MPSTVNGIGTWYYGKDNLVTRNDRCEFCGNYGVLKSYDTTLYFVVVFIPLIPLGRKRILDECPSCKRHRAAKLAEWERRKAETILEKTQAWQQERGNREKAFDAIGSTIAFHDAESFSQLAGPVRDAFRHDADAQVFLGDSYDHFGDKAEAEAAYRAALTNRPDEPSNEALARFLVRQIRPAEAEPLLAHVLSNRQRDKAGLILALAETYQAVGDHESAFRLVDEVGTTFPDMLSEPAYERIRRSVAKHRGTNKIVKSAGMDRARGEGVRRTSWMARNSGGVILGGVILIALAIYLSSAVARGKHNVVVVNGTPHPYTADINGRRVSVPAMGHARLELPEGTLKVSVPEKSGAIEPATVELRTNFWSRPFNKRDIVINPDRIAVVMWEQTEYSHNPSRNEYRYHVGDVLYNLDSVDYVFEPFPQSIKISENSKGVKKTRLDTIPREVPLALIPPFIEAKFNAQAAAEWSRRFAAVAPDDLTGVVALASGLSRPQQIEYLRAHLSDRPTKIEWHRHYQSMVQVEQPDYDLVGEYRELLKTDPDNSVMTYLLARLMDDRDEATALFKKASEGPKPCGYAMYALSHDALVEGDYARALELARSARKLEPQSRVVRSAEVQALEAIGRPGEAQPLVAEMEQHKGTDVDLVADEVRLLVKKGDVPAARSRIDAFCQELGKIGFDEERVTEARNSSEASLYYASGDMAACRRALAAVKDPHADFQAALIDAKPDLAQKALDQVKPPGPDAYDHLALYLCAKTAGRQDIADAEWKKGIETLKGKSLRGDRLFAQALESGVPPSDKALRNWVASPTDRAVMLAALGLRYPQKQSDYFAAARKLNYSNQFPSRLIAQVTK